MHVETSKKEDTWCEMLGHYDAEIFYTHSFVFQMIVARMAFRTETDGNPNLLGVNANDADPYLNAYNGNPTNRWNRENGFVFLSPKFFSFSVTLYDLRFFLFRIRLVFKLIVPATKHLTGLGKRV